MPRVVESSAVLRLQLSLPELAEPRRPDVLLLSGSLRRGKATSEGPGVDPGKLGFSREQPSVGLVDLGVTLGEPRAQGFGDSGDLEVSPRTVDDAVPELAQAPGQGVVVDVASE